MEKEVSKIETAAIGEIAKLIKSHRERAYRKINEELVTMYFEIGKYLSEKVKAESWGAGVIENIAKGINEAFPTIKGFGRRGLYRMMQFYEIYSQNEIVSPLVAQISWTNNLVIMSRPSSIEEKEFYIRLCIKNNYSKRELMRQISSHYYERYLLSHGNALESNEKLIDEEDYPNTKTLDQYSLEFLDLPNNYSEKDLRKSIVSNLKYFILEIGKDFSFIGEEYRIDVGGNDYYIDLLFYNRTYSCLVAFELKIDEFKPEYVSKMDFYLEALDRQEKKPEENPSIGIILCSSKNTTVVEYSMARRASPIAIADYSTKLIDQKLLINKIDEWKAILKK